MAKVRDFLIHVGRIIDPSPDVKPVTLAQFLAGEGDQKTFGEYRQSMNALSSKYSTEDMSHWLHWESISTPYLHNLDGAEVLEFVKKDLVLQIVNHDPDRIVARKPRRKIPGVNF